MLNSFENAELQALSHLFNSEVYNFYDDIRHSLETVIFDEIEKIDFDGNMLGIESRKEQTEVYFQFEEESLGIPCFLPTKELCRLVLEWKDMEIRMRQGVDIFPLVLED